MSILLYALLYNQSIHVFNYPSIYHLPIYSSIHPSILSVHTSIVYISIYSSFYPSNYLSIYSCIYLSILSIYPSILSIYPSILSIYPSIYPSDLSIHQSYLSIRPSIYPSHLYDRFAGQVGWVVSIGPDTLKSTMQTANQRIALNDAFRTIYRQYGELSIYHIHLSINHIYLCIYL